MVQAEDITNAIAKILLEDVDIQAFCNAKFGKNLSGEDNLVYIDSLAIAEKPSFTVVKLPGERHFFNKEQTDTESEWTIMVSFFGDFGAVQTDDDYFILPAGAKETINGVTTYTPSDTMRILARMAGQKVYEKINCSVPGVLVSMIEPDSEDYYDAVNGMVKSFVQIGLYKKSTSY